MPAPPDAGEAARPQPPGVAQVLLPPGVAQALAQAQLVVPQPLMQGYGGDDIPFLCMAGVREYHEHPAHSGDHWESYRTSGAGRLVRLVDTISKYGLEPIKGFEVQMVPKVGFLLGVPPE